MIKNEFIPSYTAYLERGDMYKEYQNELKFLGLDNASERTDDNTGVHQIKMSIKLLSNKIDELLSMASQSI